MINLLLFIIPLLIIQYMLVFIRIVDNDHESKADFLSDIIPLFIYVKFIIWLVNYYKNL